MICPITNKLCDIKECIRDHGGYCFRKANFHWEGKSSNSDYPGIEFDPVTHNDTESRGGFHWRDGLYFKRMLDGSIRLTQAKDSGSSGQVIWSVIVPPAEWASIVCSVSAAGETDERWNAAQDFHGRMSDKPGEVK